MAPAESFRVLDDQGRPITLVQAESGLKISGSSRQSTWKECLGSCFQGSKSTCVPYRDILWSSVDANDKLVIDFVARPGTSVVEQRKWRAFDTSEGREPLERLARSIQAIAYGPAQQQKKAMVLVNPSSGPGHAAKLWEKQVKPLFSAARMHFDVVFLKKGGEATELMQHLDYKAYDTVIACSGDGTPHEIFNGLAKRPDAGRALRKLAIAQVPCGSGNAMAINFYGSSKAAVAAIGIIKGVVTPVDLVSITQGEDSNRYVSVLSQAVGIIAESDLATEHLRWMGSKRFEVGLVMRIWKKQCYPCDLAIKVEVADKEEIKRFYADNLDKAQTPEVYDKMYDHEGLPELKYGTVNSAISSDWQQISTDKIGNFYCGNMVYMAPDAGFFPAALPSDGCMDLVTINGDLSTVKGANVLLSIESGNFYNSEHVSYQKISAYRITPRNQHDGYISIDGEKVPFEPFQCEIHQGLGRVLTRRGRYEAAGPKGWEKYAQDAAVAVEAPKGSAHRVAPMESTSSINNGTSVSSDRQQSASKVQAV
ncbi:ATP-NAD kinase-like domain-containing protein [Emericellopsis atlantica]|uniref:ATP-NAD kinase-like domain-containing protein n=1 Tax=Emericellopsis atlantica TaxID=2614577 RepID=A0A9P8CNG6_9HYPO|nr:ATP-NAD kinase-like domain-containing protein [Emericellopsis atlantica]KAG9253498.1 ATP-NAD kinase-like domain-containing protein [Emericellopsis atlantica]